MLLIYATLPLLSLWESGLNKKAFNTDNYLSMDSTNTVRGIFVVLVFLSHFMQYCTYSQTIDLLGGKISALLGQMIVVMFMFYSGYGVTESVKKKGVSYVKSFPQKRIFKTLLHFDLAILIYFILGLILDKNFSAEKVLLSLIGWESLGNSNWYIFAMLCLYLFTWIAFSVGKDKHVLAAVLLTVFIFGYMIVVSKFKDIYWYDTVICYAAGVWYSLFKEKIERILTKNNIVWSLCFVAVFIGWLLCNRNRSITLAPMAEAVLFALLVVTATLKISLKSKPLIWLGKHTFEIYILMRIPMNLLSIAGLKDFNLYLYFFVSLFATVLLSFLFSKLLKLIDRVIFKSKNI